MLPIQKMKKTKQAQSNFKKWEKDPAGYIPKRGEFFVPVTTKDKKGVGKWYISNKGTVISFANSKDPTAKELEQSTEKNGYRKCCGQWMQQLVWFSFRDAVKEQRVNSDKIAKRKIEIRQFLTESFGDKEIIIHHLNGKKNDNSIKNLIALPKNIQGEDLHQLLHTIQRQGLETTKKQFIKSAEHIHNLGLKSPAIFFAEGDNIEPRNLTQKEIETLTKQVNTILENMKLEALRTTIQEHFKINSITDDTFSNIIYLWSNMGVGCIESIESFGPTAGTFDAIVKNIKDIVYKMNTGSSYEI